MPNMQRIQLFKFILSISLVLWMYLSVLIITSQLASGWKGYFGLFIEGLWEESI